MNIEGLKELKELKELLALSKALKNESENSENKTPEPTKTTEQIFEGEYVLVRGYDAGVWAGKLINGKKGEIILEDARMLWRWWTKKSVGLSSLAVNGLDENRSAIKVLETQKKVLINDDRVSTFYICTEEVEKQIRNYAVATQS